MVDAKPWGAGLGIQVSILEDDLSIMIGLVFLETSPLMSMYFILQLSLN